MLIYRNDLRCPSHNHSFPSEPKIDNEKKEYIWNEFFISNSEHREKGLGLFVRSCSPGFLIPYGGIKIDHAEFERRVKKSKRRSDDPSLDYLYGVQFKERKKAKSCLQVGFFDADPASQEYKYQWPACYCNEIATNKIQRRSTPTRNSVKKKKVYQSKASAPELYNARL
jgi:hypothetical protein